MLHNAPIPRSYIANANKKDRSNCFTLHRSRDHVELMQITSQTFVIELNFQKPITSNCVTSYRSREHMMLMLPDNGKNIRTFKTQV